MEYWVEIDDERIDSEEVYSEKKKIMWMVEEIEIMISYNTGLDSKLKEKVIQFCSYLDDTVDIMDADVCEFFDEQLLTLKSKYPGIFKK